MAGPSDDTQTATTVASTAPSNPDVNPTVSKILKGVQAAQNAGPQVFDHSLYAGVGPTTTGAWQSTLDAAKNPIYSGDMQGALSSVGDVAAGKFLAPGSNPYFEANLQNGINDVTSQVNSSLGASGRLGSNLQVADLTKQVGDLSTGARSAQYDTARNQQLQAAQLLPSIYQGTLAPSAIAGQVGAAQDANQQGVLQGQYDQFTRKANAPTDLLAKLTSILAGNTAASGTNTTSTQTQPGQSIFQSILGTAIGAGSLFL